MKRRWRLSPQPPRGSRISFLHLTTTFRFQNIKLRSFEFQKQYRRIPTHKECTNAKNFAYKRCMLGGEICSFDVIKHEGYFFQLDSRTARELKVDAYIELHNVLVELYLHKRCNLAKPTEIFEAVQNTHNTCFFLILALLIFAGMNTATNNIYMDCIGMCYPEGRVFKKFTPG